MAQKAKTAQQVSGEEKRTCPDCSSDVRVVRYAGFGPRGLFWVCDKNCGYTQRTR
ncbi:MAG: hypothetical protein V3R77_07795 [Candidatus Binatia bacterium]